MTELQIKPEERALQSIFGEAFSAYRKQTRRWL
jgi:protein-S-isoprenylcysteine O-methyltransferase Ste14